MKRMKRSVYYCENFGPADLYTLNEERRLSEIKDIWRQMSALDMILQDKRAYIKIAQQARTRQKRFYFEGLVLSCSVLIRMNQHWYRRFDRYLAGGHILHAFRVLKTVYGYTRELREFTHISWIV